MNLSSPDKTILFDNVGLFNHLTPDQRIKIEQIGIIRHYAAGEIVFYEGDESNYFHFLLKGEVNIFKVAATHETMLIHRFRAPSLIAEVATLKQIPYPASCESTQESAILKISRDPFLQLIQNDPSLSIALISSLTQKISALESSLQRHSAPNALAKVSRLIRDDSDIFHRLKGIDIARLIGVTPETLSRMVKKLKSEGVVSLSKSEGITILLPKALERYCG